MAETTTLGRAERAAVPAPPPPRTRDRRRALFALATFGLTLFGYVVTLAPTVTFWDAGEFIAASHILGIPHPPGTPLFILLGRIASVLPLGLPVAVKTNLLSASASALGGLFYFLAVSRVLEAWQRERDPGASPVLAHLGAMAAVLISAFGLTVWQNSTETEVYTIAMMTIGLVSWLVVYWRERRFQAGADNLLLFGVFLMGMSVGNHLMALLCLPAAGVFVAMVLWPERRGFVLSVAAGMLGSAMLVLKGFDADAWLAGEGSILNPAPLLVGGALLAAALVFMVRHRAAAFFGVAAVLFLAGASIMLYLKIRAALDPVINEADPSTWKSLVEVLLRRQYDVRPAFPRTVDFFQIQIPMYLDYLFGRIGPFQSQVSSQFGGPAPVGGVLTLLYVVMGVWGAVEHFRTDRQSFVYFLLVYLTTSLGLVVWLNFKAGFSQAPDLPDLPREVRERDYFFIVSYAVLGIWVGIGAFTLLFRAATRLAVGRALQPAAVMPLVLLLPGLTFALNHHEADRSGNYTARDFAFNLLQSAEPFGIVFTNGDNDTFPLWYAQEVEGVRRDVVVANLSLLNTTWYLEQLGSRPFSATAPDAPVRTALNEVVRDPAGFPRDPVVEEAVDLPAYIPLRDPVDLTVTAPGSERQVRLSIQPGYLRRQDLAVLKIVGQQLDRRPVYFSVTVPTDALVNTDPYLTRVGILYEVNSTLSSEAADADTSLFEVPNRPGLVFDVPRSDALLWEVYRYRGLTDDDIYKDSTTRALTRNYGYTLLAMSEIYYFKDQPQKARRAFELAQAYLGSPREEGYYANALKYMAAGGDTLAIDSLLAGPEARGRVSRSALESAALLAALKGRYAAARSIAERKLPAVTGEKAAKELWVRLGDVALESGDSVAAENFYAISLRGDRDFQLGYLKLVSTAGARGQLPSAIAVVENWVRNHPADSQSARLLAEMKSTQRFPEELRWENVARYFKFETLPGAADSGARPPS